MAEKTNDVQRNWLQAYYKETVVPALIKEFNYTNINQVPKIEKIVLNMGLGDVRDNAKSLQLAVDELKLIAGQKPIVTKAKKSVANFKVREGQNVGAKVTLRGQRMYDFFAKLTCIALPRVRDFKGVSRKSFDGRGNYALGVKEQFRHLRRNHREHRRRSTGTSETDGHALRKELGGLKWQKKH